jgi:hypothetical protein
LGGLLSKKKMQNSSTNMNENTLINGIEEKSIRVNLLVFGMDEED